jgi:hypothetical protein
VEGTELLARIATFMQNNTALWDKLRMRVVNYKGEELVYGDKGTWTVKPRADFP